MNTEERIQKLPDWIKHIVLFLKRMRVPGKIVYILISAMATIWFLVRVIPKPSRAMYPCMQLAAPIMSSFVIWILAFTSRTFSFRGQIHCCVTVFNSWDCFNLRVCGKVVKGFKSCKPGDLVQTQYSTW